MAKSKSDFQKFMAIKLLKESTVHYFAGLQNAYDDGDITKEEALQEFDIENFVNYAGEELSNAMKDGRMLQSPMSDQVMEAKHLKFLGSDTLTTVKVVSGANAFIEFNEFVETLNGGN